MNIRTIKMFIIISVTLIVLCMGNAGFAQDAGGCGDHTLLPRMQDFVISEYEYSFDVVEIAIAVDASMLVEGYLTRIEYVVKENENPRTSRQIMQHYDTVVQELGGEIVSRGETILTCQLVKKGKEFIIVVETDESRYTLKILEIVSIIQYVVAGEMIASPVLMS